MHPFSFEQASDDTGAIAAATADKSAKYLAGGTTLVDLMKLNVETPAKLIDIHRVDALRKIEKLPEGGLRLGANASNTEVAYHADVQKMFPVLSQAILSGASTQIRNMATVGGNLLQRTRCPYFRDNISNCNKRNPGSGCDMMDGFNRIAAVLGGSEKCVATHPSDMAVALVSLDAVVRVKGPAGERTIPIADFHLLPGDTPEKEAAIAHGELITAVDLPAISGETRQAYLKIRDRASYEFALASVAAVLWLNGPIIERARLTLGGVGTKPWHAGEAEAALAGNEPDSALFRRAAEAAMAGAKPLKHNAFKVELAKRAIQRVLGELTGVA